MKKKLLAGLATGLLLCGMAGMAQASLTTIGTATYGGEEVNLIWDDDNNGNSVIWLDFTTPKADWTTLSVGAPALDSVLTYNIDAGFSVDWGSSSWRLPDAGANPVFGATNQTDSELGHLFYIELGLDANDTTPAELNASAFDNLVAGAYWTGTDYASDSTVAWMFSTRTGTTLFDYKSNEHFGVVLHDAEVTVESSAVPLPGAVWLLGAGLTGLIGLNRSRKGSDM